MEATGEEGGKHDDALTPPPPRQAVFLVSRVGVDPARQDKAKGGSCCPECLLQRLTRNRGASLYMVGDTRKIHIPLGSLQHLPMHL